MVALALGFGSGKYKGIIIKLQIEII